MKRDSTRPQRTAALALAMALGVALGAAPARSQGQLVAIARQANAEQLCAAVHAALQAPVTVRLMPEQRITVAAGGDTADELLDQVASAVRGNWRRELRVAAAEGAQPFRGGGMGAGGRVTLDVKHASPRAALTILARSVNAQLVAPALPQHPLDVTLADFPAEKALDHLTKQLGLSWHYAYVISGPPAAGQVEVTLPPAIFSRPATPAGPALPDLTLQQSARAEAVIDLTPFPRPERASAAAAEVLPRLPRADGAPLSSNVTGRLREGLRTELRDLLSVDPAERPEAVRGFVQRVGVLFDELDRAGEVDRNFGLIALRQVRASWERIYRGLAPSLQAELAPVTELFRSRLGE